MAPNPKNYTVVSFSHEHTSTKLVKWNVVCGNRITIGSNLFTYQPQRMEVQSEFKSTTAGTIIKILKQNGQMMTAGDNIFILKHCLHPIVMKDVCVACGTALADVTQQSSASEVIFHSIPELRMSKKNAKYIFSNADTKHLLDCKKLALLVDLDQTLIHTTNDLIPDGIADVFHYKLHGMSFHTRLRPGTKDFLRNMSEMYELHICTFGDRRYAVKIARLLDPDGSLFSKRILSRDEFIHPSLKSENIKIYFPCGDAMVCIIDDRGDVWNYAPNLLDVKPYNFFQGKTVFDGQQLHRDDTDSHLVYLEAKLRVVHQTYYKMYEMSKENNVIPDVKNVVPDLQRSVLKGVCIVFSGVVPTDVAAQETEIGRMAMALGAVIQDKVVVTGEQTTHVISSRLDTEKVYQARLLKGVHLVSPDWLWCCAERWQKENERLFPLVENYCVEDRNKILTRINPVMSCTPQDIAKMSQQTKGSAVEKRFVDKIEDRVRNKRKFAEFDDRYVKKFHSNLPARMPTYKRYS